MEREPAAVASERFLCLAPSGEASELRVEIGPPSKLDELNASCTVLVTGGRYVSHRPRAIHGSSTLQALCLALSFARTLLRTLEDDGYVIADPDSRQPLSVDLIFGRF